MAEFGGATYFKAHGKHDVAKAESSFTQCTWLGKDSEIGENLITTPHGVIKSNTSKQMIPS